VFSVGRALAESSRFRPYLTGVKETKKIDDLTVEIITDGPSPILVPQLTQVRIMSKAWSTKHNVLKPQDFAAKEETYASRNANGTGPYILRSREADVKTVMVLNSNWWGKVEGNVNEIVYLPIKSDSTRVAALLSGEIDFILDPPPQDIPRLKQDPKIKVVEGSENRTIFLGMDQNRDELLYSSVKGKNPLKDKRVRQALYQAIDIEGIRKTVMRGAASPTGLMIGSGINGFQPDMNKRLPFDAEAAKKLLADAGYAGGFEVTMNCPNDRYVNDSRICQAVAANLSRIGVKINLAAETKGTYFPKILRRDTSFYLLGWTPSTVDAHDPLNAIMSCVDDKGAGQFNLGAYCNPKIDELARKVQAETDKARRNAMIREAFQIHQEDIGHIPLHQQALAWGVNKRVDLVQRPDNNLSFKWIKVKSGA